MINSDELHPGIEIQKKGRSRLEIFDYITKKKVRGYKEVHALQTNLKPKLGHTNVRQILLVSMNPKFLHENCTVTKPNHRGCCYKLGFN